MVLEKLCKKRKSDPRAAEVIRAGNEKRLRSTRCGSLVICRFGKSNRWHFARHRDEPPCTHGHESEEHEAAIIHLTKALKSKYRGELSDWRIGREYHLKRVDRKADIIARHRSTEAGVVLEVQKSPLTRGDWEDRRKDYDDAELSGDYWLVLGTSPPPRGHSKAAVPSGKAGPLVRMFAEAPDQRSIYLVATKRDDRGGDRYFGYDRFIVQAYERFYIYWTRDKLQSVQRIPFKCRSWAEVPREARGVRAKWRNIPLNSLRLDSEGQLGTELDEHLDEHVKERAQTVGELYEAEYQRIEKERVQHQEREEARRQARARLDREQEAQQRAHDVYEERVRQRYTGSVGQKPSRSLRRFLSRLFGREE